MTIAVIRPWRACDQWRQRLHDWTAVWWRANFPDWQLVEADDGQAGQFCEAAAVNRAVAMTNADVLVIAMPDVIASPEQIRFAAELVHSQPWVIPFNEYLELDLTTTSRLLDSDPAQVTELPSTGKTGRGCAMGVSVAAPLCVVRRKVFLGVGGADERQAGWTSGWDLRLSAALDTLAGRRVNVQGQVIHLWHPPRDRIDMQAEWRKYRWLAAWGRPEFMLELVHEYAPRAQELRLAEPGWPPIRVDDYVVRWVRECGIGKAVA